MREGKWWVVKMDSEWDCEGDMESLKGFKKRSDMILVLKPSLSDVWRTYCQVRGKQRPHRRLLP